MSLPPTPAKSVIVTGGNTGLGFECAKQIALASPEWQVIIACRNPQKAAAAVASLVAATGNPAIHAISLDLSSLMAVRKFVEDFFTGNFAPLSAIVCNAGMSRQSEPPTTADGIETTFGVNYLGHLLLVNLLLDHLAEDGKIVLVSSELHRDDGGMKSFLPRYTTAHALAYPPAEEEAVKDINSRRYSTTKLCLLLFGHRLAANLQRAGRAATKVLGFNPGLMPDTGLGGLNKYPMRRFFLKHILPLFVRGAVSTPAKSGKALAALVIHTPAIQGNFAYFDRGKQVAPSKQSQDPQLEADLWATSSELTLQIS